MNYKIKTSMRYLSDTKLPLFAENVIDKMTDNKYFPKPYPQIKVIQTLLGEYNEALILATEDKKKEHTTAKNNAKKELVENLTLLGGYINLHADGSKEALDSTGYVLASSGGSAPDSLPMVEGVRVLSDNTAAGTFQVSFNRMEDATGYIVSHTSDDSLPITKWLSVVSGTSTVNISGFDSAIKYFFKVTATNSSILKTHNYRYSNVVGRISQ